MLSRLATKTELSSKNLVRCFSQVAVADDKKVQLPQEIADKLNKFPARMEIDGYTMPGAPYEGMGPLPPVPDYEDVKKDLKFYFLPKSWFDFFYEKTGVTGPYVFAGAVFTALCSKEYYMFGHNYDHHSRQIFWMAVTFGLLNKNYGESVRDFFEDFRTRKFIAMDQIKEAEVESCYEELEEVNLAKWRAGLSEFYNEAKQVNLAAMLETCTLERQAMVAGAVRNKLEYHKAVQGVDKELAQNHMVEWVEGQVMQSINEESQEATLDSCIAELHVLAEKQ